MCFGLTWDYVGQDSVDSVVNNRSKLGKNQETLLENIFSFVIYMELIWWR